MFTYTHTTTRRLMSFHFFCALFTSKVGRSGPSPTSSCLQVIITQQTLIFHLEVLYTTICLHPFLKKLRQKNPAHLRTNLAESSVMLAFWYEHNGIMFCTFPAGGNVTPLVFNKQLEKAQKWKNSMHFEIVDRVTKVKRGRWHQEMS